MSSKIPSWLKPTWKIDILNCGCGSTGGCPLCMPEAYPQGDTITLSTVSNIDLIAKAEHLLKLLQAGYSVEPSDYLFLLDVIERLRVH